MCEREKKYIPYQVIFVIIKKTPPRLKNHAEFSEEANNFISLCLNKDPDLRPSAAELLSHPFAFSAELDVTLYSPVLGRGEHGERKNVECILK